MRCILGERLLALAYRTICNGIRLCAVALMALLSGCSTLDWEEQGSAVETRGVAVPVEDAAVGTPGPAAGGASPAVVALLDQAATQQRGGHAEQSAATLERALRIEPRNPWLWFRLAEIRLQMGMARRAEQLALKSNALAGADPRLAVQSWLLIARARERLGDAEGAERARKKADQP